jgi:SanA protein
MMKMLLVGFSLLVVLLLIMATLPGILTRLHAASRVFDPVDSPGSKVAIVFGAGLYRSGAPTPVLRDRITTAVELYQDGKVEKLLMSGDNSTPEHNEPGAMRDYAISLGVPDEDIILDYAGRRTYDTCYRARDIFHIDSAILVTQSFHLPRALYTCNTLGVSAVGVPADLRRYRRVSQAFWNLRESAATAVALWQVHISHPEPILGNPEPIFPREAQ